MSLTFHIFYKGKDDNAYKFVKEMIDSGIVEEIRKEEGNLQYAYFYPFEDKNTVLLIDSWVNQEALDRHHNSKLMEKIANLRNKYNLHMTVEKFTSIKDDKDSKYIRK